MQRSGLSTFIALAALCFFMVACGEQKQTAEKATPERAKVESLATTPEDIKKEAKDLARTTMAYTEEQKTLYEEKIQEKMAEYSQKLAELEAKLVMLSEQAKEEMVAEMANLSAKKQEMAEKIGELQAASGEAYNDLKEGVDKAMAEMDKAYEQAIHRFGK